jgi:hypothetical protein
MSVGERTPGFQADRGPHIFARPDVRGYESEGD